MTDDILVADDDTAFMLELNTLMRRIKELSGLELSIQTRKGRYELHKLPKEGTQRTTTLEELMDSDFAPFDEISVAESLDDSLYIY